MPFAASSASSSGTSPGTGSDTRHLQMREELFTDELRVRRRYGLGEFGFGHPVDAHRGAPLGEGAFPAAVAIDSVVRAVIAFAVAVASDPAAMFPVGWLQGEPAAELEVTVALHVEAEEVAAQDEI